MSRKYRAPRKIVWTTLLTILLMVVLFFINQSQEEPVAAPEVDPTLSFDLPDAEPTLAIQLPAVNTLAPSTAEFDYYVLSLSWSPDYCATDGGDDTQQCSLGRKLGFVLHGLWPQYDSGYPSYCSEENLPAGLKKEFPGLFPNDSLFSHEWEKHGTCSGLSPRAYFELSDTLKQAVIIPDAYQSPAEPFRATVGGLQDDFLAANPTMPADGLTVYCSGSGRFLSELRVCFDVNGAPRTCGTDLMKSALKSCGRSDFLVRNVK